MCAFMYLCLHGCTYVFLYLYNYVCMHIAYGCVKVRIYVCKHVCVCLNRAPTYISI